MVGCELRLLHRKTGSQLMRMPQAFWWPYMHEAGHSYSFHCVQLKHLVWSGTPHSQLVSATVKQSEGSVSDMSWVVTDDSRMLWVALQI